MTEILGAICARGGSTGVPGKNIMPIAGKPLIAWSIENALADPRITDVIVSTDDPAIAEVAVRYGAKTPFVRPQELATSKAGKFGVWKHALSACESIYGKVYDAFIDIDCTTPLLDGDDLAGIIDAFMQKSGDTDGIFTVSPSHRSPYFNLVEEDEDGFLALSKKLEVNIEARQASPLTYDIVAGYYIFEADYIRNGSYLMNGKVRGYPVPREKSFDIDEPFDAKLVNWLMEQKHAQ
ncbi:MAG: acylneuraminate cytidylyltransferase family protein [Cohaesibacter sp.]|nr:acylneuraminate cytidylyltransferase family protein [Cohaesibacter sp.]